MSLFTVLNIRHVPLIFCSLLGFCCLNLKIPSLLQSEMIRAYVWHKTFHLILTALLHYLIENCTVNINACCIFYKNSSGHFSKPFAQNKSNMVTVCEFIWVYMVCFKWPVFDDLWTTLPYTLFTLVLRQDSLICCLV